MKYALKQHEDKIAQIVNRTLGDTFSHYFKTDINQERLRPGSQLNDLVTAQTYIHDKTASGLIFISIERNMLQRLSTAVFPPEMALSEAAIESCLTEISNIVCNRIKTYFNDNGYDMVMDIPTVTRESQNQIDNIQILFSVREDKLMVDIGFTSVAA